MWSVLLGKGRISDEADIALFLHFKTERAHWRSLSQGSRSTSSLDYAALTVDRNASTCALRRLPCWDSSWEAESTWAEAEPVSTAP